MRAIILAAEYDERLMPYTRDIPKCLVELAGRSLLLHQIEALNAAGVEDIHVVTGYRGDRIADLGFHTLHNVQFAKTSRVMSLMRAADLMDGTTDVLIARGDIVYEPRLIREFQAGDAPLSIVVDRQWRSLWKARFPEPPADLETVRWDADGCVVDIGCHPTSPDEVDGRYVGLTKVSASHARGLVWFHRSIAEAGMDVTRMDMTGLLQVLLAAGWTVQAALVDSGWLEVDSAADLNRYRALHAQGRLDCYWRAEVGTEMHVLRRFPESKTAYTADIHRPEGRVA